MKHLKYAAAVIPIVALIAIWAMFGKMGVRPKALPVIKASTFSDLGELGYWTARQTRQKIFRNQFIFFGVDPDYPATLDVVKSFLTETLREGNGFDVLVSPTKIGLSGMIEVNLESNFSPEQLVESVRPYLQNKKRVAVVGDYSQSSKLFKGSMVRKLEYEHGQKLAAFSVVSQTKDDLESLKQASFCSSVEKLTFESPETLRCLFPMHARRFEKELDKQPKPYAGSVDQFGLDDYVVYVYRR